MPENEFRVLDGPALWSAQAHLPSVLGRQLVVTRAEGSYVHTADGRALFDGTAGLWHANVGHARPELADAAYAQMRRLETYHVFGRYLNDRAVELADRLAALSPVDDVKVILNSGGSDAIDVACKLARRHWQLAGRPAKTIVLSREFAYHGLHAYGTSIAGLEFNRTGYGSESLVPETARISADDVAAVERTVAEIGAEHIAALVAEPVQGTGGVHPPSPGYLEGLQRICRDNDILFVVDEVITGFGRTGTMFASERYGLTPDLLTFAKGVTSGYAPLGGVLIAPAVWRPFYRDSPDTPVFRYGSTYSGHATACAVALRNLALLEEEKLLPRVVELEFLLAQELEVLRTVPGVAGTRVAGFLGGVTLDDHLGAEAVADELVDHGFVTRPLRGNTLQISPPFITTDDELRQLVKAIGTVVTDQGDRRG
ncbi:aspartate aminotransferase family protein [Amycolatopsis balhimycina DSM 5908]|uniref:Aspartate aminotransferase family protein n=1 Tax=Amycolatopsis balhimycina DSM 5908 TaxID=1081091 RepID=A0A428WW47_AMYBA|nr:aminotransferase class III-fold pyridoxal phosphate-dependent enzyme [Amycolatopsis balhimycina]RSM47299.1 aspartate aminotransferase family protein [Amycolatopsis balhimycina DSM 5908]